MTSRRRRRVSDAELARLVRQEIAENPRLSQAAIARRLRDIGYQVGNQRVRGQVRAAQIEQYLIGAIETPEPTFMTRARVRSNRATVTLETNLGDTARRVARAAPTHVVIEFRATVRYTATSFGVVIDSGSETIRHRITQPIGAVNIPLVYRRIVDAIADRIKQRVFSDTDVEGADVATEVTNLSIETAALK